jgi:hypothetical protein
VPRVSLEQYKNNLKEIIRISKENNIQPVLLTRPYIWNSPDELWWKYFAPDYNSSTIQIAKREGIPVIDVYTYFKDKELYFEDESHFSRMGHMVASVIIYESIFSSLPSTLRTINISEYLERLYNDFNGTKTLIPKKLNSKLTNFFSDDFYWTKGNGIISDVQYDKQPQDNFLVVKTFGWNPLRNELMKPVLN